MKIELELPEKPEVHHIAAIIGEKPETVVGRLIKVWAWFDKHTENGHADRVTLATMDHISGVTGFGEAMQLAGWLEQHGTTLIMPKFDRHTSESAKKRALAQKRKSRQRHANSHAESVTETGPEKRREEKILKATPGAKAPDPTKEEIWKTGKALLEAGGFDVKQAGSFLGKLCKEYGQILVLQAVRDCVSTTPAEPHTWLIARCQERRKDNGKFNVGAARRKLERELAEEVMGAGPAQTPGGTVSPEVSKLIS